MRVYQVQTRAQVRCLGPRLLIGHVPSITENSNEIVTVFQIVYKPTSSSRLTLYIVANVPEKRAEWIAAVREGENLSFLLAIPSSN